VAVGGGITITTTTMEVVAREAVARLQTMIARDDVVRKDTKDLKTADFQQINIHLQPLEEIRKITGAIVGERSQIHREEIHTTPAVMEVGIVGAKLCRTTITTAAAAVAVAVAVAVGGGITITTTTMEVVAGEV
jgi:hypothetical protein